VAAPHENDDGKHNVEDREDGTAGNAERSELADVFSRYLREFMEELNRHATEAREELLERERIRAYPGAAIADFEAMSYQVATTCV